MPLEAEKGTLTHGKTVLGRVEEATKTQDGKFVSNQIQEKSQKVVESLHSNMV